MDAIDIAARDAFGDGRDATRLTQSAIDEAHRLGGGEVVLPRGTVDVRGLVIRSRVTLRGQSEAASVIRLIGGSNRNVIETENFAKNIEESRVWFVQDGMPHGFQIRNCRVDGNAAENKAGHGVAIYGKRYVLDDVLIHNCAEDGLHSHGPDIGGQKVTDDILEGRIGRIHVDKCRGNGITFRGPHDSHMESAIIGVCGGIGLLIETITGHCNGGLDVGRVHAYACRTAVQIRAAFASIERLMADASLKEGVIVDSTLVQIGQLWAFKNWLSKKKQGADLEDAHVVLNQACQVGVATVRTDYGGTGLRIRGTRAQIGSCQIENTDPKGGNRPGIGIDVLGTLVRVSGDVRGFSEPGSIGVRVAAERPLAMTSINCTIVDCETGFVNLHGGDAHNWNVQISTTKGQTGFKDLTSARRSSVSVISRGADSRAIFQTPV